MDTLISAEEQRVLDLIDLDDIVKVTRALIAAPGENPPGQEAATVAALRDAADDHGLSCELSEAAPGRPNITVTMPGGGGPGLLILGHTDVVPIGDGWTVPPLGGVVRDGRLHGRGSTDMLGGLAAAVAAMGAIQRSGIPLSGRIDLAAVVDEEETGKGIQHFLASQERATYMGCIVGEPTDLRTVVAARGAAYIEVHVTGKAAHSGNPANGANSIYGAAAVVECLERWHHELAVHAHPLVGPPTWSVGLINGGISTSTVPAECTILVDRRMLPAELPAQVLEDTRQRITALGLPNRGLSVEVTMTMDMPGFETPSDDPFVQAIDAALTCAGGPALPLGGWTAACDGGYVARETGIPVVVLGPGSVEDQAHRADESVPIGELLTAARSYALTALYLLRASERPAEVS